MLLRDLFIHEAMREVCDTLPLEENKAAFTDILEEVVSKYGGKIMLVMKREAGWYYTIIQYLL